MKRSIRLLNMVAQSDLPFASTCKIVLPRQTEGSILQP